MTGPHRQGPVRPAYDDQRSAGVTESAAAAADSDAHPPVGDEGAPPSTAVPPDADTAGTGRQDPVPALVEMLRDIAEPVTGSDLWVVREAADALERLAPVVAAARAETAAERRLDAIGSVLTRRTDDWRHGEHSLAVAAVRSARLERSAAVRALEDGER